jgi:transposase
MVHEAVGFDSAKQIDGRKRFTLVDTLGLLMAVHVVAANVPERTEAKQLLAKVKQDRERFPRLARIWVDGGFSGEDFFRWVIDTFRWILETVLRPRDAQGFVLLLKRWVVERTYGWLHWCRRLNVDYEHLTASSEALIYIAWLTDKTLPPHLSIPSPPVGEGRQEKYAGLKAPLPLWERGWGEGLLSFVSQPATLL